MYKGEIPSNIQRFLCFWTTYSLAGWFVHSCWTSTLWQKCVKVSLEPILHFLLRRVKLLTAIPHLHPPTLQNCLHFFLNSCPSCWHQLSVLLAPVKPSLTPVNKTKLQTLYSIHVMGWVLKSLNMVPKASSLLASEVNPALVTPVQSHRLTDGRTARVIP